MRDGEHETHLELRRRTARETYPLSQENIIYLESYFLVFPRRPSLFRGAVYIYGVVPVISSGQQFLRLDFFENAMNVECFLEWVS